jgi:hypothetical protein
MAGSDAAQKHIHIMVEKKDLSISMLATENKVTMFFIMLLIIGNILEYIE